MCAVYISDCDEKCINAPLGNNAGEEAAHRGGHPGAAGWPPGEHQGLQPQVTQIPRWDTRSHEHQT